MFKSVFIKFVTAFLLINLFCMLILTSIISSIITVYSANVKSRTLENAAAYISSTIGDGMEKYGFDDDLIAYINAYPEHIHAYLNATVINVDEIIMFVVDSDGRIVLSGGTANDEDSDDEYSIFAYSDTAYLLPGEYIENLRNSESHTSITTLGGLFSEDYMVYSLPLKDTSGRFIGGVVACSANSDMNILLSGMRKTIFMSMLWLLLALLVVTYIISEKLVSPIRAMSRAAKSFAKGQFDVRVSVKGNDEISELASAFNNMASSLSTNEEMRRVFLANISHDLRTPMTTISGFIDGILDGAIPPEKHEYYLGVIATEVRRLSRLVSALLDITKIQAGERKFTMVSFDICEMCRQVLISSEQRIEAKKLDVQFNCDSDNMYVIGDTDAIHQIIYNLLDNAIKFSRDGGLYEISIHDEGQKVRIGIYNEGVGIPEGDLPYVFDRFYKSDKSRGLDKSGVGLGLYIARTIIEAHGETITVESEYEKWCRFTFTLPKGAPAKNNHSSLSNKSF